MVEIKRKIPRKRFKNFIANSAWNNCELSQIADVRDGTHSSPRYYSRGFPLITSKNVKDGHVNFDDVQYISKKDFCEINKRSKVDKNDILMGMIGTIGNIALVRSIPKYAIKNVALIKETQKNHYLYIFYYLQSPGAIKQLTGGMDGGTQKFIALNKIRKIEIPLPSIQEQQLIAEFMNKIEKIIGSQQQKINRLKNLKSAYLNDMFPKEGENVPKLRFAGFEEPWEKCKISDIFKITRGHVLAAKEVKDNKNELYSYPVYSSQTTENGLMGYYNKYLYENAITWTTDGANAGTVTYRGGKFYCTNVSGVLLSDKSYANKLIAEILNKEAWKHVSKVGNPKLMNNVMAEINITIPKSTKEQELGSNFFDYYDDLISIEKHKLEKLKQMKQAYLNEMFV